MIQVFPADERYSVDNGWLRGRPSFSFGEYADPANTGFGVMRVCNDDFLDPGKGFGAHPHSDMEIVSIVLKGQIRHEDSLGNVETASAGELQRMSAGTGIVHAEYNPSETEELNLLQLWFMPRERGLAPSYETGRYDAEQLINTLVPVVTPDGAGQTASIQQDMTIYLGRPEAGRELIFKQEEGRRMFLFNIEGSLSVNGTPMAARDTARIESVSRLTLSADEASFVMLIDLP
ncbi:pirin family protein [Paenibacillus sepulcri]